MTRSPFSRAPIVVDVAQESVSIPYRSAAEWVYAMTAAEGPAAVITYLARDSTRGWLLDELAAGELTPEQMSAASYSLIEQALPAFRWWESYRLLMLSAEHPTMGRTTVAGMDPWSLTASQWCSGLYVLLVKNLDDTKRFQFDAHLSAVPDGVEDDEWGDMALTDMVNAARNTPGMGQGG